MGAALRCPIHAAPIRTMCRPRGQQLSSTVHPLCSPAIGPTSGNQLPRVFDQLYYQLLSVSIRESRHHASAISEQDEYCLRMVEMSCFQDTASGDRTPAQGERAAF